MVDAVVSFVVQRLGDYLIREAANLQGVRNQMQLLKDDLEWMQEIINHADKDQVDDPMIRKWMSSIKDIAYNAEDVLDSFILKIHDEGTSNMREMDEEETLGGRPGFFASIKKCSCISNQNSSPKRFSLYSKGKKKVNLYTIGKEIEALRQRMDDLSRKREFYRLQNTGEKKERSNAFDTMKELRKAPSFVVEENIVGFEDDTRTLLTRLLDPNPLRSVISIYGMGGLGKTTLAKKLYHSDAVNNLFPHKAWVSVSQDYNRRDLLQRIIESFDIINSRRRDDQKEEKKRVEKMNEDQLERYIHDFLRGNTNLLVIDDVWRKETWESLKRAFPDDKSGSRVIITTRIQEVAERSDCKPYVHKLRFLSPEESWNLFSVKAFQNSHEDELLKKLGTEMVEKCRGLPLAIIVLGGLLSTKKPNEWREVRDHLWRHLREDSIHISTLLDFSFSDLPYQLKLCFLYLGLFPEDFEINVQNLIRLLVAEGFIAEAGDLIMEELAENNLKKLINRSLLQVEKICWGRVRTCRVHDLLRDLAIEKAKELEFIHNCDEIRHSSSNFSIMSRSRRHAIYSATERCLWLQYCNPLSRSLLFFNQQSKESSAETYRLMSKGNRQFEESFATSHPLKSMCSKFRVLRVLDVEVWAKHLPNELGKLIHLRYLGLRLAYARNIPASIVNLQKLQTLRLNTRDEYINLPTEIFKLLDLRHLVGYFTGPLRIDTLRNLLTLKHISYESWANINPERLVNLRELRVESGDSIRQDAFSLETTAQLRSLRSLSVWFETDVSITSLQSLAHCPFLIELRLCGKMENLPRNMDELLPNLESLILANSYLEDDPMPSLEKLPNLMFLVLYYGSHIGKKMIIGKNGFPRLEILEIYLVKLEELLVDDNAMPTLRGLKIAPGSNLRIPERLASVPLPGRWECTDRLNINDSIDADI